MSDTRWRMPPESCRGYLSIACVRRSCANSSLRPRLDLLPRQPANVRLQHDVVERGAEVEQQVVLEGDADVGDRLASPIVPPTTMSPRLRFSSPATISISVLLPQPDGPTTEMNSPASMSTLTSFSARNGLSSSSPKVFDTRLMLIGTPDLLPPMAVGHRHAAHALRRQRRRRRDGRQRHLGHEQRLAAPLHDAARPGSRPRRRRSRSPASACDLLSRSSPIR